MRAGDLPAVHPDLGPIIDPFEGQPDSFVPEVLRQLEYLPKPPGLTPGIPSVLELETSFWRGK